ncbi:hypothetical protein ACHAXS_003926 [Conticribra weissflogii]
MISTKGRTCIEKTTAKSGCIIKCKNSATFDCDTNLTNGSRESQETEEKERLTSGADQSSLNNRCRVANKIKKLCCTTVTTHCIKDPDSLPT